MKIFVIGGTGLVGSYLLPELVRNGHVTYALTRAENKAERIERTGAIPIIGDIRDPNGFRGGLPDNLDVIVLLAMPAIIPGHRITKKRMTELRNETNDFFRNTLELAKERNAVAILPSGTSFETKEGEVADETWTISRKGLAVIGADTDEMVLSAFRTGQPRAIQLLYGKIYGNGSLFRFQYEMMEKNMGKIIGKGTNCIPNIHARDAASAIVKAVEKRPVGERFIIADDLAVSLKDFAETMAMLMGKRKPGNIPAFVIRMVMGKDLYETISMNCVVSNEKAKRILDWKPVFPTYQEGLKAAIEEMRKSKPFFA